VTFNTARASWPRRASAGGAAELQHQDSPALIVYAAACIVDGQQPVYGLESENDGQRRLEQGAPEHWRLRMRLGEAFDGAGGASLALARAAANTATGDDMIYLAHDSARSTDFVTS
jgi:hypothetical protein